MTSDVSGVSAIRSTLVQHIELWQLAEDGQSMLLQDHARIRGSVADSAASERRVRLGEGIAGMAWNQRNAIILQEDPSELLQRIGTQNGLELTALIAFPVMRGQDVLSVVVLGISDGPGAFEVWSRDDRDELSISASYYSGLRSLEFISRFVRFPKGAGLPGKVWKTGQPGLAPDLVNSPTFMRSFDPNETQLSTGLGLPVGSVAGHADSILVLLSSHDKPIASLFEIWAPDSSIDDSQEFRCVSADGNTMSADGVTPERSCHAAVRSAWQTGRAVFSTDCSPVRPVRNAAVDFLPIRAILAIPIYRGPELAAVVTMRF